MQYNYYAKTILLKCFQIVLKFKNVHLIEVFKILGKKSSAGGISKTAGWILTKFALQVHLSLQMCSVDLRLNQITKF